MTITIGAVIVRYVRAAHVYKLFQEQARGSMGTRELIWFVVRVKVPVTLIGFIGRNTPHGLQQRAVVNCQRRRRPRRT